MHLPTDVADLAGPLDDFLVHGEWIDPEPSKMAKSIFQTGAHRVRAMHVKIL